MLAPVSEVQARCPLCGQPVLSLGAGGRVLSADLHAVPLYTRGGAGEGYMLCDECAVLALLPADLPLD